MSLRETVQFDFGISRVTFLPSGLLSSPFLLHQVVKWLLVFLTMKKSLTKHRAFTNVLHKKLM